MPGVRTTSLRSGAALAAALLSLPALPGCARAQGTGEATATTPAAASALDPADRAAIEAILLSLPDAWNARDADAWVAAFTEDSGFTNILGMHFPDRTANRKRHAVLFATIFARSTLEARVLGVRGVGGDGAVAELELTLVGYDRLPPGIQETAPGVLRTRLITAFERRGDAWRVVAAQNTAILPVAAGAGPGGAR